ncbi:shikimate kinase [Nakamurella endophytica]|uniref:Shikimate kinase n=1 Tax=Nakamurella endophytica TaxID=1748367 RepID=A0A917SKW7_9ACTN|nr:shikimate kinase [Nakamurella endophytica]GGL86348.1 shikimate kinase [Nakamurella endophytica]
MPEAGPAGPAGPLVVLVGPPGSGKTTVARRLAVLLGVAHRDTDADVERATGRGIPEIFVDLGEAEFRRLERDAVRRALAEHRGVLSLGGGAVLSEQTRAELRGHPVAFLSLSMPVGVRRTGMATNRPLLAGVNPRATYKTLLDARVPLYREVAAVEVDTDELSADEVAARIVAALGLVPQDGTVTAP